MKAISRFLVASTLMVAASLPVSRLSAQETMSAKELAARLSSGITDGSSFIKLRMEIRGAGKSILNLQLKERRTREGSDVLYQVLFPKERKGESVLLQRRGGKTTGKIFTPATGVKNISSMKEPLFGSDLSYEDIIENFFAWEQQSIVGTEQINKTTCQILESKSGG